MNTKTILNIKMEKTLKKSAQKVAEELGIPLSAAINAFLKQFAREKTLTLSASKNHPTPYLQRIIKKTEEEYSKGLSIGPFSGDEMIAYLKKISKK